MIWANKALLLAACLTAQAASAQTTVDVPIDQAGQIAAQAVIAGDPAAALQIAQAILAQQPDNRDALIVVTRNKAAAPVRALTGCQKTACSAMRQPV